MYCEYKMCEKILISKVTTVTDRNMNYEHQIYIKRKCRLHIEVWENYISNRKGRK